MANSAGKKEQAKNKPVSWITVEIKEEDKSSTFIRVFSNATLSDYAGKYMFDVRRYKITSTKEEYLNVKVYEVTERDEDGAVTNYSSDECAIIERVSFIDLESRLLNLRIYGVMLERKHFPKVRQEIEKNYLKMTARPVGSDSTDTTVTEGVIRKVYGLFVSYIKDVGIAPDKNNELYNIPVDEFKECLSDSYSQYKYSEIRSELAQFSVDINGETVNGTKCSFGRNDNTIMLESGKRIKVISFVKKVVDNWDSYQVTKLPEG